MKKIFIYSILESLIQSNGIYVDKTEKILKLINMGKGFFLVRPRRFGKSITINTMKEIFLGNSELFKNTYIGKSGYPFDKFPVLSLDMSNYDPDKITVENYVLKKLTIYYGKEEYRLNEFLEKNNYHLDGLFFEDIIRIIYKHYNKMVVVLIDEYDKPILTDKIDNDRLLYDYKVLKGFYPGIKEANQSGYIKFIFVTGLTRIFQGNVFSGLNHLKDISEEKDFADLVGFTEEEIKKNYSEYIKKVALSNNIKEEEVFKRLHKKSNGYNYGDEKNKVFNSWSILNALESGNLEKNYWSQTGTLTFVAKLMKLVYDQEGGQEEYKKLAIWINILKNGGRLYFDTKESFDFSEGRISIDSRMIILALYFAGYLTKIKEGDQTFLICPNLEAYDGLNSLEDSLKLFQLKGIDDISNNILNNIIESIVNNNQKELDKNLSFFHKEFILTTPTIMVKKQDQGMREENFQLIIGTAFKTKRFSVFYEQYGIQGRSDIVIFDKWNKKIFILELKSFNTKETVNTALAQAEKYVEQTVENINQHIFEKINMKDVYIVALLLTGSGIESGFKKMG